VAAGILVAAPAASAAELAPGLDPGGVVDTAVSEARDIVGGDGPASRSSGDGNGAAEAGREERSAAGDDTGSRGETGVRELASGLRETASSVEEPVGRAVERVSGPADAERGSALAIDVPDATGLEGITRDVRETVSTVVDRTQADLTAPVTDAPDATGLEGITRHVRETVSSVADRAQAELTAPVDPALEISDLGHSRPEISEPVPAQLPEVPAPVDREEGPAVPGPEVGVGHSSENVIATAPAGADGAGPGTTAPTDPERAASATPDERAPSLSERPGANSWSMPSPDTPPASRAVDAPSTESPAPPQAVVPPAPANTTVGEPTGRPVPPPSQPPAAGRSPAGPWLQSGQSSAVAPSAGNVAAPDRRLPGVAEPLGADGPESPTTSSGPGSAAASFGGSPLPAFVLASLALLALAAIGTRLLLMPAVLRPPAFASPLERPG
jgi:hypothetical protein